VQHADIPPPQSTVHSPYSLLSEISLSSAHRSFKLLNDSIFNLPAAIYSLFHGFSSICTAVAPSLSNDMELVPKQFAWAGHTNWLFLSYTEDVSFWSVLSTLSVLEALFATMRYINWHLHYITSVTAVIACNKGRLWSCAQSWMNNQ